MNAEPLTWEFESSSSWHENIEEFARGLESAFRLGSRDVMQIQLLLEEILVNVTTHGKCRRVSVRVFPAAEEDVLEIIVTDDGEPFDPSDHPPPDLGASLKDRGPGGLGIHLVRKLSQGMRYQRRGSQNVLLIRKKITGA